MMVHVDHLTLLVCLLNFIRCEPRGCPQNMQNWMNLPETRSQSNDNQPKQCGAEHTSDGLALVGLAVIPRVAETTTVSTDTPLTFKRNFERPMNAQLLNVLEKLAGFASETESAQLVTTSAAGGSLPPLGPTTE
jgi:hypothetical protein